MSLLNRPAFALHRPIIGATRALSGNLVFIFRRKCKTRRQGSVWDFSFGMHSAFGAILFNKTTCPEGTCQTASGRMKREATRISLSPEALYQQLLQSPLNRGIDCCPLALGGQGV